MHWLTDHFRIKHQYVDGLVTPANLKFGYELQCLAFTLIYRCLRLNAQIDIVTTCSIVDAGAEHRNGGVGDEYFPHGIANDFLGVCRQVHIRYSVLDRVFCEWRFFARQCLVCFTPQLFDFVLQSLIFSRFSFEKMGGELGLFFDTSWGHEIDAGPFAWVTLEVTHLNLSLVDECLETIVDFSQTDAQRLRQLALTDIGLDFNEFKDAVVSFV